MRSLPKSGDSGPLHLGQHPDQRQFHIPEQLGRAARGQVGVKRVGQFHGGLGPHHQGGGGLHRLQQLDTHGWRRWGRG